MTRLFLRISGGIFMAFLIAAAAAAYIAYSTVMVELETRLPPFARMAASAVEYEISHHALDEMPQMLETLSGRLGFPLRVVPADSALIDDTLRRRTRDRKESYRFFWKDPDSGETGSTLFVPLLKSDQLIIVGPIRRTGGDLLKWQTSILLMAVVLLIISSAGIAMAWSFARRFKQFEEAAAKLGGGDLHVRVEFKSNDAAGTLALRFNEMAERIEQLVNNQKQLIQAVAHELRTPIARIRFGIEMMAMSKSDEEKTRRERGLEEEMAEMEQLVEELLVFVRLDSDASPMMPFPFTAEEVLARQVSRIAQLHPDLTIALIDSDPELEVYGDIRQFSRAVQNLLSNAAKYAKRNVTVTFGREGNGVIVTVRDDGPGIPEVQRLHVIKPFVRLDESRSRHSGGVGLGLAIVHRIVSAHGGELRIGETETGGAEIATTWPTLA